MEDRLRAKAAKQEYTERMLAGIMTYVAEKRDALAGIVAENSTVYGITNDEVEELLAVSDTTAAKYLRELTRRGLLEKHGKGRGVRYEQVAQDR